MHNTRGNPWPHLLWIVTSWLVLDVERRNETQMFAVKSEVLKSPA